MKTASDFLDALRAKHKLTSDYQLAKLLGMKTQQISRYRGGHSTFDDTTAAKIADFLGIEPGYVMACMAAQRAHTDDARRTWEKVARKVGAGAALAVLAVCTYTLSPDSLIEQAAASLAVGTDVYYVKSTALLFALISAVYLFLVRRPPASRRNFPRFLP